MQDLERILHEYLVKDLLALKETRVAFPTLMTVFAGVELLGALVTPGSFGTDERGFRHYWTDYLYPASVRPRTVDEAEIIYEFARHGVMHHFFPRGMIGVTGSDPGAHLTCRSDGVLTIDVRVLVDDFVRVYEQRIDPILATPIGSLSRSSMQKRLDDIRDVGKLKMARLYKVFQVPPSQLPNSSGGPSGPA